MSMASSPLSAYLVASVVLDFFSTLWTLTLQVPPSMGFSRQEYWSGLPFPSPGDLPNPVIKLHLLCLATRVCVCVCVYVCARALSCSVVSNSLCRCGLQPLRLLWGFSRQEYWSGLLFSPLGDLLHPGIGSRSLTLQADFFFFFFTIWATREALKDFEK